MTQDEQDRLDDEKEDYFQKELIWLKEHGRSLADVLEDEEGREFVFDGPDDEGKFDRIYLSDVVK